MIDNNTAKHAAHLMDIKFKIARSGTSKVFIDVGLGHFAESNHGQFEMLNLKDHLRNQFALAQQLELGNLRKYDHLETQRHDEQTSTQSNVPCSAWTMLPLKVGTIASG
jgi:hypothetical protein